MISSSGVSSSKDGHLNGRYIYRANTSKKAFEKIENWEICKMTEHIGWF